MKVSKSKEKYGSKREEKKAKPETDQEKEIRYKAEQARGGVRCDKQALSLFSWPVEAPL